MAREWRRAGVAALGVAAGEIVTARMRQASHLPQLYPSESEEKRGEYSRGI